MNSYVTGGTIRSLREKRQLTQKQLGELVMVSDKTVSKWETGRGLPDITLLEPLAGALGVCVTELLSGACASNRNRSGNLSRARFYVCPVCGNVLWSIGEGAFSCCGIALPPLEAESPDPAHLLHAERVEDEWYVSLDHPMTKEHFLSFMAYVTTDRVEFRKLYPQQPPEARFSRCGPGVLLAYCSHHGLYETKVPPADTGSPAFRRP